MPVPLKVAESARLRPLFGGQVDAGAAVAIRLIALTVVTPRCRVPDVGQAFKVKQSAAWEGVDFAGGW